MGVRNKTVKKAAEQIVAKFYYKLDNDFHHNKLIIKDIAEIQTKRLRNQVAGYVSRLYGRIQKGTVKKIYIKKHEEERIRKENLMPKESIMDKDKVEVDTVTMDMLKKLHYEGNFVVTEIEKTVK